MTRAAFELLADLALAKQPLRCTREAIDQAGVSCAVAWHFVRAMRPELASPVNHPALHEHSVRAETLPEFIEAPHGDATVAR